MRCKYGLLAVVSSTLAMPVFAAVPGFIENFTAPSGTFFGGSVLTHVPAGGVGGAGDGYLRVAQGPQPGHLGAATQRFEIVGNLLADGVTGYSFWLSDVGADDPLEIHVGVGTAIFNFWIYSIPFTPPENGWGHFTVDFSDPADWVQTHGSGTFQSALTASDRLLFRHDLLPLTANPEPIAGDFGLDRVMVLPEPAALPLLAVGGVLTTSRRALRRKMVAP